MEKQPQTKDTQDCIAVCNSLLRGEISAVETYDQALEKFEGDAEAVRLRSIRNDHSEAVITLRRNIQEMGGAPEKSSGAWGDLAKSVQGAAKLFGEGAAISALKQGEEQGRSDYEKALEDERVLKACKDMIRSQMLPRQQRHIAELDSLQRAH
jgi:uncharacterized protein (TIGR02284 family)